MSVILPASNLPREGRALIIAIAEGESDVEAKREGISPYNILVGGGSMEGLPDRSGYYGFPAWAGWLRAGRPESERSHAAGRAQFQPGTWLSVVSKMFPQGLTPNFRNPGDQDWGAWFLAQHDYKSRTNASLLAVLRAKAIGNLGSILKPTWASLSDATFPARYAVALAAVIEAEKTEGPSHPPPLDPTPTPTPPANPIQAILAAENFQDGVRTFQNGNGLTADGVIGRATLAKISALIQGDSGVPIEMMTLADIIADIEDSVQALKEYESSEGPR